MSRPATSAPPRRPIRAVSARSADELATHLDHLRAAPSDFGTLTLLVRRPAEREREVLDEAVLDPRLGLVGDSWLERATVRGLADGRHLEGQLNVMPSRMVELLADDDLDRAEAGDQLYLDLDSSVENLPVGTRLAIGEEGATIQVTRKPHAGCGKFVARFGRGATDFVNSPVGKELRLRGFCARVATGGVVRPGDVVRRLPDPGDH